jgi:hypothetical protein
MQAPTCAWFHSLCALPQHLLVGPACQANVAPVTSTEQAQKSSSLQVSPYGSHLDYMYFIRYFIPCAQGLVVSLHPMTRAQKMAAAAAGVGLAAAEEDEYEEEGGEEHVVVAPKVVPRGSAVLTRQALLAAKRATSPVSPEQGGQGPGSQGHSCDNM